MSSEEDPRATREARETTEEDLQIFETLSISSPRKICQEDAMTHDLTTNLRSELAALEYKRDRLTSELQEMKSLVRSRDQRIVELQVEAEQLREQAVRQNAIVSSLKKRIQELEERERNLYASQGRNEITIQGLQRDLKYHEERIREYEKKIRQLEQNLAEEIQQKERARASLQECARKLAHALNVDYCDTAHPSLELVIHKAEELAQEANRLRAKSTNVEAQLATVEVDFRSCRDALDRAVAEKEQLQRQVSSQSIDLDRLRQDKECLEMQYRVAERETNDLRDKLLNANRSITSATGNISSQETVICQLREDLKHREEKMQRMQNESRHFLESLAILVGGPNRYVESHENAIKDRIREILAEYKDQTINIQNLREKLNVATESTTRQGEMIETTVSKMRGLEDERSNLESKVHKLDSELTSCELSRESLRRDKQTFMTFLDRLGKVMQMDEISEEMGLDLLTESLLVRAEQLARLETDKLVDKYSYHEYVTLPRIRRERSFHELSSMKETSVVYQLQRRVRTLREQLQRRDLHLDLLRRKLSLQEDSVRMKSLLQTERDEANLRAKKLSKQIDRLQVQFAEEKSRNRELSSQLTEAADYKIAALERSRKIEELQKRLVESEMLRTRCNRKLAMLKEQMRSATETAEQERSINDHSLQLLRGELAQVKQNLSDLTKRESQLQSFRVSVVKLLSEPICTPDYEIISRLQKMVAAHRDFTMLSRRYDEPLDTSPSRCTSVHPVHPPRSPGSRCTRYEDSGFADPPDLHDIEDDYNKRPIRSSLLP
ncbi:coiled-coil domain-containing protein 170 isoform X2 [Hylaeus anthracinus]|uniref:coiled-coil domain-containing protein 170 isoform X2 n=2 Tax=Hylaeus anthracinus TaxID=313031 RepID=UPI0023B97932|nr:coiled-coil domain-containing protein 170 isoform X2 [Hylaeus anthracinus]XP_054002963.1 coiled-coil domain-containing protein 170 isoform X2 [Hylaeus anthracinus]XP_054002965.1 coiled-coil domain-containing protein 170 isoform X2 [Hylaeus anthracinus]